MSERLLVERAEATIVQSIQDRYERLSLRLDKKNCRLFEANAALAFSRGGIVTITKCAGIAQSNIRRSI